MSFYAVMTHPTKGRMNVPEVKLQQYLEDGFVEVERIALEEPSKPAHVKAAENIEAKAADEEKPKAKKALAKKK